MRLHSRHVAVLGLLVGVFAAPAAAEMMVPTVHMPCDGDLPANGFKTDNVSQVCGTTPPVGHARIVTDATVPDGYLHVPHYYRSSLIDRSTIAARVDAGPCYTATVSTDGAWHRLTTDLSGNPLCAYGAQHHSTHIFNNPVRYLAMKIGVLQTSHVH